MLDLVYRVIHHCPCVIAQFVAHINFLNEHVVKIDAQCSDVSIVLLYVSGWRPKHLLVL